VSGGSTVTPRDAGVTPRTGNTGVLVAPRARAGHKRCYGGSLEARLWQQLWVDAVETLPNMRALRHYKLRTILGTERGKRRYLSRVHRRSGPYPVMHRWSTRSRRHDLTPTRPAKRQLEKSTRQALCPRRVSDAVARSMWAWVVLRLGLAWRQIVHSARKQWGTTVYVRYKSRASRSEPKIRADLSLPRNLLC